MKKYVVITGASSGLGAEFARQLSNKGYAFVLIARRAERLQELAQTLHAECEIISADLTKRKECERVYNAVKDKKVELFINNAGFGDCGRFMENVLEKERQMIQLNIQALHFFTKKMVRKMQKSGSGFILNVASSAGLLPAGPYMAVYYATKAYVASLTRAIAVELRERKSPVYIGCLCPGPVDTEFNRVANVDFALKGISAEFCVRYALAQMKKRKTVIIPSMRIKLAVTGAHILPSGLAVRLIARQQKKKMH